ncbi:MAG TPA: transposase [Acidiferrobacterales bacterium]|jgi:putative transposase
MARQPRYRLPGVPQHVIHRSRRGRRVFASDQECRYFLDSLAAASRRYRCAVHAYVLMPDHLHLLVTPELPDGVARLMQTVGRRFVRHNNRLHQNCGPLWDGRYKATVVDVEHFLMACYHYIETNPVRAGLVADPADYPWSSCGAHALGRADPVVRDHAQYLTLGATPAERQARYRELCRRELDARDLAAIRDATNAGWALGGERFQAGIETELHRRVRPLPRGGRRTPSTSDEGA